MIERKRTLDTIKSASQVGNYDEVPVLAAEVDPQLHLSRNSVRQPFFLICEHDTVLAQMTGRAQLELRDSNVSWFPLVPGDNVYVPARTPHRVVPETESVQLRYKARRPGREAAAFYCERCGSELYVHTWDANRTLSQGEYLRATQHFNAEAAVRTCRCGQVHPPVDLAPFGWAQTAAFLEAQDHQNATD